MPRCCAEDASLGTRLEKAFHHMPYGDAWLWLLAHPAQLRGHDPQQGSAEAASSGRKGVGMSGDPCGMSTT